MGRRGNPYDNAKAESFMKTLKVEAVYLMAYCESACNKDPLFGVIGFQSGPRNRGSTLASMILGSRGWDAGRGDDCKDPPRVF
jgi:transposase InsO family protein